MIMPLWLSRVLQAILSSVVAITILDNSHPYNLVWASMYYCIGFPFGYWRSIVNLGPGVLVSLGGLAAYSFLGAEGWLDWLNPTVGPAVFGYIVGRLCQHITDDAGRRRLREESSK